MERQRMERPTTEAAEPGHGGEEIPSDRGDHSVAASTLARVESLQELPRAVLQRLAGALRAQRFDKGVTVVRHNDASRDFYIIISGSVRVTLVGSTGRALTYQVLPAGEMFGEVAAVDGDGRSASVVTEEESVLGSISAQAFLELASSSPEFGLLILKRLARLNRRLTSRLFEYHTYDVRGRVYLELLRLTEAHPDESVAITDRDMASRVGTTRENVSRIHGSLRDDGLIRRDKSRLTVLDRAALASRLADCEFG